jgi:Flp pilus assembly protein TadG
MLKSKRTQMSSSKTIPNAGKRTGAVTAEVAVCLPILFLLLFGCLEMAGANMLKHATESAAYEGARIGILPGATQAGVQQAVDKVLDSIGAEGSSIEILPQVITQETEEIEVVVSVPYAPNAWIAPFIIRSNPTFRSSCKLRRELL